MKAMILAAGRGQRMGALTEHQPKPLLSVRGKPLIVWHLQRLAAAGFRDVIINVAYHGQQIMDALDDGAAWGVRIRYSVEASALETAGGIVQALPLLGAEPFFLLNADVWCEANYGDLRRQYDGAAAFLFLVSNPAWKEQGDFNLQAGQVCPGHALTFAGLSFWRPEWFAQLEPGKRPLIEILRPAVTAGRVRGALLAAPWSDVGTPERLQALQSPP